MEPFFIKLNSELTDVLEVANGHLPYLNPH